MVWGLGVEGSLGFKLRVQVLGQLGVEETSLQPVFFLGGFGV